MLCFAHTRAPDGEMLIGFRTGAFTAAAIGTAVALLERKLLH